MSVRPNRMKRSSRLSRWLVPGCGVALAAGLGVGVLALSDRATRTTGEPTEGDDDRAQARRLPNLGGFADHEHAPAAAATPPLASRVPELMNEWRSAIIQKNAESVENLDRTFAAHPNEFIPALMASAEGDPEERVRSFSTRVLGKLRPAESTELIRKLLADRSEYVRFNAAWALGELADHAALPRLREMQRRDPAASVRESAAHTVRKLSGG